MSSKGVKPKRLECPICKRMIPISNLPVHLRNKHPDEPLFYNKETKTIEIEAPAVRDSIEIEAPAVREPIEIETGEYKEEEEYEEETEMKQESKPPIIRKTKPQPAKKHASFDSNDEDEYFYLNL